MISFFGTLGFSEMIVLLGIGVLLYGRNLPEAGRTLGKTIAQLRRGFQEFKDQMERDADLREVKSSVKNTMQEIRRVTEVPRAIANPAGLLKDLTNEALSSPIATESLEVPKTGEPPAAPEAPS